MGIGSGGQEGVSPWIFIHGTGKVEKDLMVLFFGLVFFRCLPPLEIFVPTPLSLSQNSLRKNMLECSLILTTFAFITQKNLCSLDGSKRKTYVDYRDPHQGVKEIACEIDQSKIIIERVIGQGLYIVLN